MNILYIDESGDTISLSQKGKKYFVLCGLIINENELLDIDKKFRNIKLKYYHDDEIEIKSNFLRNANPDISNSSPIKLNSREQYDNLERDLANFLKGIKADLISVVIDKEEYWKQYPSQNPYNIAYVFLIERFQWYLKQKKEIGICIIDPREGQVEKHYFGNDLNRIHERMRKADGVVWKKCDLIAEKLLFSQSDTTNGIQLVDMLCYPIFHIFEYNKTKEEYWRFSELTYPKLYKIDGKLNNSGFKFFPDNKKKDLKFFT